MYVRRRCNCNVNAPFLSLVVFDGFAILCNQSDQGVLLTVSQMAKALQQLALMKRKLGAVETHIQIITQRTFLKKALLQTSNDF